MKKLTMLLVLMVMSRQAFGAKRYPYGYPPSIEVAGESTVFSSVKTPLSLERAIVCGDSELHSLHSTKNTCCTGRKPRWKCYATLCAAVSAAAVILVATCGVIEQHLDQNGGNFTGG